MQKETWQVFVIAMRERYGKPNFSNISVKEWSENLKHIPDDPFNKAYQHLLGGENWKPFHWKHILDRVNTMSTSNKTMTEIKGWSKDPKLIGSEDKKALTSQKMRELMKLKISLTEKTEQFGDFFIATWGEKEARQQVEKMTTDTFPEFVNYVLRRV